MVDFDRMVEMKKTVQEYYIGASADKVWQALVDPKVIERWGAGPAKMSNKLEEFSLWGGEIHGKNTSVDKKKELTQDWFAEDWKEPSRVTFKLTQDGEGTRIKLIHENIPDGSLEAISQGWRDYYLGPIKELLESEV